MNIYVLKLVTSDEIVGVSEEKLEGDPEFINLTDVFRVSGVYDPDAQGVNLVFSTYLISMEEKQLFTFPRRSVILYSIPSLDFTEGYLEFMDETQKLRQEFNQENERIIN